MSCQSVPVSHRSYAVSTSWCRNLWCPRESEIVLCSSLSIWIVPYVPANLTAIFVPVFSLQEIQPHSTPVATQLVVLSNSRQFIEWRYICCVPEASTFFNPLFFGRLLLLNTVRSPGQPSISTSTVTATVPWKPSRDWAMLEATQKRVCMAELHTWGGPSGPRQRLEAMENICLSVLNLLTWLEGYGPKFFKIWEQRIEFSLLPGMVFPTSLMSFIHVLVLLLGFSALFYNLACTWGRFYTWLRDKAHKN